MLAEAELDASAAGAIFDASGLYRYLLWRAWDRDLPRVGFILLNPSTADADRLDPTLSRCAGFARRWGFGAMLVANLFGYRSTKPEVLNGVEDPFGELNDAYLELVYTLSDRLVVGWGNHGLIRSAHRRVSFVGQSAYCLGVTKLSQPVHPLYQPYSAVPRRVLSRIGE